MIFNNGHTVEVEHEEGSSLAVGADEWEVLQFHFHAASEHTVDAENERMEMHIVHRGADGELAVLGAFIEEGMFNLGLEPVFANLPRDEGEPTLVAGQTVNLSAILPMDLSAWRYNGSLTTPPCSEGVRWHVLKNTHSSLGLADSAIRKPCLITTLGLRRHSMTACSEPDRIGNDVRWESVTFLCIHPLILPISVSLFGSTRVNNK